MKKSVRIAVGLAVVAGVASTAGAWYTGQQLEPILASSIAQANQQLKGLTPGLGLDVTVELVSLERGVLSSTAHYRVKAKGDLTTTGDESKAIDDELLFVDRIEHGPFPLSRLMRLKLMPVLSQSNFALENNPLVAKWFSASQGVSPLTGHASIGYTGNVNSSLKLQPLEFSEEGSSLKFSGLNLNAQVAAGQKSFKLDGDMDSLALVGPDHTRIELQGLSLRNDSNLGESGLYLGTSESTLKQVQVLIAEQPPLLINDMLQTGKLDEDKSGVFGSFTYGIGMLNFAGKDLGALDVAGSVKNLDTLAIKDLSEMYKQLITNLDASHYDASNPDFSLNAEQKAKLETDLGNLLAAKPVLALDKFAFKTANGQSSLSLSVGLNKPSSFDLPPDALAMQSIASLDAHLQVSKPMIKDVVLSQAALDPSADPEAAKQQAEQMSEMAGMMAVGTQMATVDGDNIVASLKYADGQVDLNGRKMPLEEFMAMSMGMAGGMGGGMPQASLDDESSQGYAEDSAGEAQDDSATQTE
ncbi:MAG: YdgA family protein [Pseudomonas sp.]|nr:YdgA family protein [Pseudomonas sp.]